MRSTTFWCFTRTCKLYKKIFDDVMPYSQVVFYFWDKPYQSLGLVLNGDRPKFDLKKNMN